MFCKTSKMAEPLLPLPPVIVIDERTIKESCDVGPVCECRERYIAVAEYVPYLPGTTSPYEKKVIPGGECLEVIWRKKTVGPTSLDFIEPIAFQRHELPPCYRSTEPTLEDLLLIRPSQVLLECERGDHGINERNQ
ncbi:UNVERIFIED_CONTAM: hypothetical protein PYX00_008060 [Menopon gallinae]|uniref:Uncharacterized protein n=1 Tax=Menopon gallinae TaxID=328185 RepID=A0AAW2HMU5_9NEOP